MKNVYGLLLLICTLLLAGCSSQKKLETAAPFSLGEVYVQKWMIEGDLKDSGYEVVIPIVSLDENEAVLQNLYHNGEMKRISIELRDNTMIAFAEYNKVSLVKKDTLVLEPLKKKKKDAKNQIETFDFKIQETEAVLSYVHNKKVKYVKLSGIRQNPVVVYSTFNDRK